MLAERKKEEMYRIESSLEAGIGSKVKRKLEEREDFMLVMKSLLLIQWFLHSFSLFND